MTGVRRAFLHRAPPAASPPKDCLMPRRTSSPKRRRSFTDIDLTPTTATKHRRTRPDDVDPYEHLIEERLALASPRPTPSSEASAESTAPHPLAATAPPSSETHPIASGQTGLRRTPPLTTQEGIDPEVMAPLVADALDPGVALTAAHLAYAYEADEVLVALLADNRGRVSRERARTHLNRVRREERQQHRGMSARQATQVVRVLVIRRIPDHEAA